MKTLLAALILTFFSTLPAIAARPLEAKEARVCDSLKHCITIVETHSHDSFDYAVLAHEFTRFNMRGRKALLKTLQNGESSHAANAADMLVLIGDTGTLAALRRLRVNTPRKPLLLRTVRALDARLMRPDARPLPPLKPSTALSGEALICTIGDSVTLDNRKSEMPFFERSTAVADQYGSFRPSAQHNSPLQYSKRSHLISARPVPGGWLAGYPDGLIHYDDRTGEPSLRIEGRIVTLQGRRSDRLDRKGWVAVLTPEGETEVFDMNGETHQKVGTLPGPTVEIRRTADHILYMASADGSALTLRPDGTVSQGCENQP